MPLFNIPFVAEIYGLYPVEAESLADALRQCADEDITANELELSAPLSDSYKLDVAGIWAHNPEHTAELTLPEKMALHALGRELFPGEHNVETATS